MNRHLRSIGTLCVLSCAASLCLPACASYARARDPFRESSAATEFSAYRMEDDDRDDPSGFDDEAQDPLVRRVALTIAGGNFRHETSGSTLDDTTDGGLFELQGEIYQREGVGGGLAITAVSSDDSLFENQGVLDTEGATSQLFLYLVAIPVDAQAGRLLVRIGPYLQGQTLDESGGDEVTWGAFGLKLDIEPELHFVKTREVQLSAFARLAGGIMGGEVEVESPGFPDQEFDTDGVVADFDIGLRSRLGILGLSIGYFSRGVYFDESDDELGVFVRETEASFRGVGIQVALEF